MLQDKLESKRGILRVVFYSMLFGFDTEEQLTLAKSSETSLGLTTATIVLLSYICQISSTSYLDSCMRRVTLNVLE